MIQRVLHVSRHQEVNLCVFCGRGALRFMRNSARVVVGALWSSVALVIVVLIRPLANGSKMGP